MGNDAMKPRTRLAKFLAKIAGLYEGDITPRTEIEYYLDQIAQSGGGDGGGGGGGVYVIDMNDMIFPEEESGRVTYSKFDDLVAAIQSNKIPILRQNPGLLLPVSTSMLNSWTYQEANGIFPDPFVTLKRVVQDGDSLTLEAIDVFSAPEESGGSDDPIDPSTIK